AGPQVKALLPNGVSALARLFPILLRIEAVGEARRGEREPADPLALRQRGFSCLRELLTRLSAQRPVLVFIDDLQWADHDSMVLLEDVLRPPDPPRVLLIASFRSEDLASQPFLGALLEHAGTPACRACRLGPLTSADTMRLTETLFVSGSGPPAVHAATIIRESAGSPFLVEQMVRYARDSKDAAGAAGNRDRAAVYAASAADKAFAALAFDRAALLYERALELTSRGPVDLSPLRARLGDALASAGRCPAAAQAYLAAAGTGASEDALQYQRRAAEQLLISGHLDAGLEVIRTVLRSVGLELAPTPRRALLSLVWRRAAL